MLYNIAQIISYRFVAAALNLQNIKVVLMNEKN